MAKQSPFDIGLDNPKTITSELVKVQSSNVYMVGYDKATKTMTVIFHINQKPCSAYQYDGVPQNVYTSVKNGRLARMSDGHKPSVGGTLNKLVKMHGYKYRVVDLQKALHGMGERL